MKKAHPLDPGQALLRKVLAGFTLSGTSMNAWCRDHDADYAYARLVLLGGRNGPMAREFRQRLATAAGVLNQNASVKSDSELLGSEAA